MGVASRAFAKRTNIALADIISALGVQCSVTVTAGPVTQNADNNCVNNDPAVGSFLASTFEAWSTGFTEVAAAAATSGAAVGVASVGTTGDLYGKVFKYIICIYIYVCVCL